MASYLGGVKECIKLLRIEKKVIRLITGLNKKESCRKKCKENNILTVTSLYVLQVVCYVKKMGDIKHNYDFHEYNTRSKYDLHTYSCNTSSLQKSVINMGVKLYKYLPLRIKKMDGLKQFRKEIKSILLNETFYTMEEFLLVKLI
jgi:hypothetical protein